MPKKLTPLPDEFPLDLQIDLLVDNELAEPQRRHLLRQLDSEGKFLAGQESPWRQVALRFLQQQVEKKTVQQLVAGGSLIPEAARPAVEPHFQISRWLRSTTVMAAAAGLLIAAISALVTLYVVRPSITPAQTLSLYDATLPPTAVGSDQTVNIRLPVVRRDDADTLNNIFPAASLSPDPSRISRRSVVIQPDSRGNFIVIPVDTMKTKVY